MFQDLRSASVRAPVLTGAPSRAIGATICDLAIVLRDTLEAHRTAFASLPLFAAPHNAI